MIAAVDERCDCVRGTMGNFYGQSLGPPHFWSPPDYDSWCITDRVTAARPEKSNNADSEQLSPEQNPLP